MAEESEAEIGGHGIEGDPGTVVAGSSGHQAAPAGHPFGQTDAGLNGKAIADILFLFGIQRLVASGLQARTHGYEVKGLLIAPGGEAAVA